MTQLENLATSPAGTAGLLDAFFLAKQQLRDPQPKALLPYAGGTRQKKELRQPTRCGCAATLALCSSWPQRGCKGIGTR
jgi:hypothetical protein